MYPQYPQPSRKVNFRQQRDFSGIFSAAFKFFKFNFKTMTLVVLALPGPLLMIVGGLNGYMQARGNDFNSVVNAGAIQDPMSMLSEIFSVMIPFILLSMLAGLVYSAAISRYLILSQEKQEGEEVTIGELIRYLPKDVWRLFYNYLLLSLIAGIILLVVVLIAAGLISLTPVLGTLIVLVGMLLVWFNVAYVIRNAGYLVLKDEILILTAIAKTFRYMKGHWWSTWGIVFCASMIIGLASLVFTVPQALYNMANSLSRLRMENPESDSSITLIILSIIAMVGSYTLMPLFNVFCALIYHSHEEEEEGTGLKSRIDEIELNN